MKTNFKHIAIALAIIAIYVAISAYYIAEEKFGILLFPFIVFIGIFMLMRMDLALLLIILLTPLSVPLREYFPGLGIDMYLPTEPLLVFLSLLFLFKIIKDKSFDSNVLRHPVTLTIFFSLFWILVTSVTSSMPTVSFKFLASRLWFVIPFFFMTSILFKNIKNIRRFITLYSIGLILVIFYTINHHLSYGLNDQEASNWVCSPFYNDHTSYGAALAMMMFAILPLIFSKTVNPNLKKYGIIAFSIIVFALVFSYTRAAWVSVVGALGLAVLILFKIKFKWVALLSIILIGTGIFFYNDIMYSLEKNKQDSSGNFSQHISSITNIKTDASNVERLNRWNSAIRMFKERPVFGWGPGTYMFQYAPFQYSREKTIISTNSGDGGNAHSEYLGPMAESGIFGPLYFILIAVFSMITGIRIYHNAKNNDIRILALGITLGLFTYILHSVLNNFLDTDKLSALFWGFIAMLVSLDLYHGDE